MDSFNLLTTFLAVTSFLFFLTFNPIEAVLWLMLTCACLSFYLLIASFPFFAGSLLVLYVSAITVLFVYVILMLPARKTSFVSLLPFFVYFNILLVVSHLVLVYIPDVCAYDFNKTHVSFQDLGLYLFTDGAINFVILTFIFFMTLIGLFILQ